MALSFAAHFASFAGYNHWANCRVYFGAASLSDAARNRPIGLFFGSLHHTLNHLLVTDRIWLGRLTGQDPEPGPLDKILYADFAALFDARLATDQRITDLVHSYDDAALAAEYTYANTAGTPFTATRATTLTHLFNHQTHHRGQVHTGLSILSGTEPPSLDLVQF